MNTMDRRLQRLFQAAARANVPTVTPELSLATEARVLADWRSTRTEGEGWGSLPWFRRGFAVACAVAAVVTGISFVQIQQNPSDLGTLSNAIVNLAALP